MTLGAVEQLLYDLGNSGRARQSYSEDPEGFLSRYRLSDEEAMLVRREDVAALFKQGHNPMLIMGFYLGLHGPMAMAEYLSKMPTLESRIRD